MIFLDQWHQFWKSYSVPLATLMLVFGSLFGIYFASRQLLKRHANYIYSVWYFYFLLATITFLTGVICSKAKIIDSKGEFHGHFGDFLNGLLKFIFALNEDMMAAGGIVLLILGPQCASYLFSGALSGCASTPRYTGFTLKFVFFNLAKSFVISMGVLLGLGISGYVLGWESMGQRKSVELCIFSLYGLMLAFYMLSTFGEIQKMEVESEGMGKSNLFEKIHVWMTRNIRGKKT